MEKKKGLGGVLGTLFDGKGFYIVLLLSAAVIATSMWMLFAGRETYVEETAEETKSVTAPAAKAQPEETAPEVRPPTVREGLSLPLEDSEKETEENVAVFNEAEESAELPLYFIWPVNGTLERRHSMETLLYDRTMADWRAHDGWDITAPLGAQVQAAADGTVASVYQDSLYGTVVEIDHGNGVRSRYANLADMPTVSPGQSVRVGDVIGAVGDTALCEVGEEYHLHFAMSLNGVSADPANWIPER